MYLDGGSASIPGPRKFIATVMGNPDTQASMGDAENVYLVDSRDNSISILGSGFNSDFDKWLIEKFTNYKDSNFKFGNDMYDPTEQIEVDKFFNYLRACIREEIIDSI